MSATTQTRCALSLWWGEHSRVALEVASEQPLGAVLDEVAAYLEEYLKATGAPDASAAAPGDPEPLPDAPWGWRLRTPIGTFLHENLSLSEQGVARGAALELVAASPREEFTPRVENVSAAVAEISRRAFPTAEVPEISAMLAMMGVAVAAVATVCAVVAALWSPTGPRVAVSGAVAAAWLLAAVVTSLSARASRVAVDAVWAVTIAIVPAAVAAASWWLWQLPPVLSAAGLTVTLAALALLSGRYVSALTAVLIVAGLTVFAQGFSAQSALPGPVVCCAVVVFVVAMLGRAELTAQRLARIPRSVFPSGSGRFVGRRRSTGNPDDLEPAAVPPDPRELFERVVRSNEILVGLLAGYGVAAAAVATVIVTRWSHSLGWLAFAVGLPVLFAYRVFSYAGRVFIATLLASVSLGAVGVIAALAVTRGTVWAGAAALLVVLAAAVSPLSIPTQHRGQSPLVRGARVISEYAVVLTMLLAPVLLLNVPYAIYNRAFG